MRALAYHSTRFTPSGIVALTFSIVAAILGLLVISWYGLADMGTFSMAAEARRKAATNVTGR